MWSLLSSLTSSLNVKIKDVNIDNWIFKLHYRLTFWTLLLVTALIWTSDPFGDKVKCGHSRAEDVRKTNERLDHVINSYCITLGLFTIPRHFEKNSSNNEVKYPGVGPFDEKDEIRKISWYQWVPYVLLIQALSFYVPRLIWRVQENRTLHGFVNGFANVQLLTDAHIKQATLDDTKRGFFYRVRLYQDWAKWLSFCEILNFLNVVGQWFLTNWFLQGYFTELGSAQRTDFSYIDIAFPKMAKCTFIQIGPSGSVQENDVFCLLTYNIVYEKIYLFLWFWFIFLTTVSGMALIHRLVSYITFKTKVPYNASLYEFSVADDGDRKKDIPLVFERVSYCDWVFLQYLLSNLENDLSSQLVASMAKTIRKEKDI